MKAKNLKGLFSKLSGYGDDALRMASNYGDNALQLTPSAAGNQLFNMAGVADGNGYNVNQLFNKLVDTAENSANPELYAETLNDVYKYTDDYLFADRIANDNDPWWLSVVKKRNSKPVYPIDNTDDLPF